MGESHLDLGTDAGWVDAVLRHGATRAALQGISAEQLEAVYALAYADIQAGRFEEAIDRCGMLAQHDPGDRRFLVAFALCLQHLEQFESAARFYGEALLLDATDALCAFRIGECLGALGELTDAREALEMAVKLSWLDTRHAEVREYAQQRLDELVGLGA